MTNREKIDEIMSCSYDDNDVCNTIVNALWDSVDRDIWNSVNIHVGNKLYTRVWWNIRFRIKQYHLQNYEQLQRGR